MRAHAGDRQLAEHGDVDQARIVAIDARDVGIGLAPAESAGAEVFERVDRLDLLEREHVGLKLADGHARERLLVNRELVEARLVDLPAALVGLSRLDALAELPPGKQVLDVKGGEAQGGCGEFDLAASVLAHPNRHAPRRNALESRSPGA